MQNRKIDHFISNQFPRVGKRVSIHTQFLSKVNAKPRLRKQRKDVTSPIYVTIPDKHSCSKFS